MALALVDFFDLRYDHRHKSPVIFLKDIEQEKYLPVWIGELEASSIELAVIRKHAPRPLTHDLFVQTLGELGATVDKVIIDRLESRTYFATLFLNHNGGTLRIDCRPSDAVAIALRENAQIFVDDELMYKIRFVELSEGEEEEGESGEFEPEPDEEDIVEDFQSFLRNISPTDFREAN